MKFCTKCGKQLEDNEVCSCTTQNVVNDPFQQTTEQETFYQSSQTTFEGNNSQPVFNTNAGNEPVQGSSKKTIIGLVAAAAVVVVLGILLVVSLAGGGYKKPYNGGNNNYKKSYQNNGNFNQNNQNGWNPPRQQDMSSYQIKN